MKKLIERYENKIQALSVIFHEHEHGAEKKRISVKLGCYRAFVRDVKQEQERTTNQAITLLRELNDHQNGPPLARHEKEYNETMKRVQYFLNTHENK